MSVPALRFKDEAGRDFPNWTSVALGDVVTIRSGISPSSYVLATAGNYPFLKVEDLNNCYKYQEKSRKYSNSKKNLVPENSIIFPKRGAAILNNKVRVTLSPVLMDSNLMALTPYSDNVSFEYLYYKLFKDQLFKIADTSSIPQINNKHILPYLIYMPNLLEQTKIANFLTAVDEKISLLTQKHDQLNQYKKGVMQQIFSQELRFKDDDGQDFPEWEVNQLNNWLNESKARNSNLKYVKNDVLSVSGEYGVVNQIAFMGRSYAGASVHNYHILEAGDIVYTKSPLKNNPYGIIKFNNGLSGIVSTLYAVYKCNKNVNGELLEYYFQIDSYLNNYLKPLVKKGAKNDMKVNNAHVLTGFIALPTSIYEQNKIVKFLNNIDDKITATQNQLKAVKQYKQGLLQQMFV